MLDHPDDTKSNNKGPHKRETEEVLDRTGGNAATEAESGVIQSQA